MAGFSLCTLAANTFRRVAPAGSTRRARPSVATTQTTFANGMNRPSATLPCIFATTTSFFATARTDFAAGRARRVAIRTQGLALLTTLFVAACLSTPAFGKTTTRIVVSTEGGSYHMALSLVLKVPIDRAWHILTNYAAIKRLNPDVQRSEVIHHDGQTLLRMHIKSCVLFMCFPVTQTEAMTSHKPFEITGTIIPMLSSFRAGFSRWRLYSVQGGTRVSFKAALTPSFYIPPILDSWLIKRKLRTEMQTTARHLAAWVKRSRKT